MVVWLDYSCRGLDLCLSRSARDLRILISPPAGYVLGEKGDLRRRAGQTVTHTTRWSHYRTDLGQSVDNEIRNVTRQLAAKLPGMPVTKEEGGGRGEGVGGVRSSLTSDVYVRRKNRRCLADDKGEFVFCLVLGSPSVSFVYLVVWFSFGVVLSRDVNSILRERVCFPVILADMESFICFRFCCVCCCFFQTHDRSRREVVFWFVIGSHFKRTECVRID